MHSREDSFFDAAPCTLVNKINNLITCRCTCKVHYLNECDVIDKDTCTQEIIKLADCMHMCSVLHAS